MGQYHHPVCIDAEEGLSPHALGCGLKEGEQGFICKCFRHHLRPNGCRSARCGPRSSLIAVTPGRMLRRGPVLPDRLR